jgi:hypothetical protein
MNGWTWFWIAFGVVGLLAEAVALMRPKFGDTLSEQIWTLLGIQPIVWFVGLALAIWGILHLFGPTAALPW